MELSIGKLPDHHHFIQIMRPLADWVFKFIGWLIIGATLVLAWEKTRSPFLAGAALIATVVPGAFLYSFLQWLSALERKPKKGSTATPRKNRSLWLRFLAGCLSVGLWWGLTLSTQVAVQQTAAAMLEFQKSLR